MHPTEKVVKWSNEVCRGEKGHIGVDIRRQDNILVINPLRSTFHKISLVQSLKI